MAMDILARWDRHDCHESRRWPSRGEPLSRSEKRDRERILLNQIPAHFLRPLRLGVGNINPASRGPAVFQIVDRSSIFYQESG